MPPNQRRSSSINRVYLFVCLLVVTIFVLYHPFSSSFLLSNTQPSWQDQHHTYPSNEAVYSQGSPKRVAIIGAGASGASAAFFLRRAARVAEARAGLESGSLLSDVLVYDREGYVGGRTTTIYPHGDKRLRPVELGASIFVDANRNLVNSARLFNLSVIDPDFSEAGVGIWDGHQFLFTTSTTKYRWSGWWDTISALKRYGPLSPYRTNATVKTLLKRFANLYDPKWLSARSAVRSIEEFASTADLGNDLTTRWAQEWALNVVKVGEKWMSEIMEGSTRVNYASDMNRIHALGAGVSLATGGASAIEGGNWQIFANMLRDSGAELHLNTEVLDIVSLSVDSDKPLFRIISNTTDVVDEEVDLVFFAAPWHLSPVSKSLSQHFTQAIPKQDYVHLHVTYLATTASTPDPVFFGLPSDAKIPTTILTSGFTARSQPNSPPPSFQSITYHGETYPGSGEWLVKIFSLTRLSDRLLHTMFGDDPTWLYRKEWNSYPVLAPIASYAPVEPMKGLQYLAALEPWVSTMETQTISAREAVARVVADWWGLGLGECRDTGDAWDFTCF